MITAICSRINSAPVAALGLASRAHGALATLRILQIARPESVDSRWEVMLQPGRLNCLHQRCTGGMSTRKSLILWFAE